MKDMKFNIEMPQQKPVHSNYKGLGHEQMTQAEAEMIKNALAYTDMEGRDSRQPQWVEQNIISEIYTNDHVSFISIFIHD